MTTFNPDRDISDMAIAAISETMESYASGTRASILFAQMQSGKTKAFLLLAGEMLRTSMVEHVVIFTGNRERELKKQLTTQVKGNETERSFVDNKTCRYLAQNTDTFKGLTELEIFLKAINIIEEVNDNTPEKYESFFNAIYCFYLAQKTDIFNGLSPFEIFSIAGEIIRDIKDKITIVWGTDLIKKASHIPTSNTLFIFEESHFAQTVDQSPSKFLNEIGLPANGDASMLEERNNYICSVSATPFSELCDNGHFNQSKKVVVMNPGNCYRGVKWLKDNDKIIGYENWETTLRNALYTKKEENNWAIIRVRGNEQMEIAERMCQQAEWNVRKYDQETSDITGMEALKNKPLVPTIVILRERCRMGTVVPKDHLSFLFETSTSAKTDTLLQGLLGRACGYHTNDSLVVYVNRELLASGEIETYLGFCDGNEKSVPCNAKNVVKEPDIYSPATNEDGKQVYPVIPIHIPRRCVTVSFKLKERTHLIQDIANSLLLDEEVIQNNHNPGPITQKIVSELNKFLEVPDSQMKINAHQLIGNRNNGNGNKTFKDVPFKLRNAIMYSEPARLGSGCGGSEKGGWFVLYYVDKPIENMETGSYYLCCYLELTEDQLSELKSKRMHTTLPITTGAEIFRYNNLLETGENEFANGGFTLSLRPETATDEMVMLETIRECILRSKETETYLTVPRRINSIRQPGFEKYTGIYLSQEVYDSVKSGKIYKTIEEEFGVRLKYTKNKGRPTKMLPEGCALRIAEISW